MKHQSSTILLITLCFLNLGFSDLMAQESDNAYIKEIEAKRKEKDNIFKSDKKSPLSVEQKSLFKSLPYFDIDKKYKIEVEVQKLKNQVPFPMTFNDGKQHMYVKYCLLHFEIDGKKFQLSAYRDTKMAKKNKNLTDYLFIPFKDLTNGTETFGGGRYLEWHIPDGKKDYLDFNNAFNPACVYNIKTKCPIPPEENYLKILLPAGEKDFDL